MRRLKKSEPRNCKWCRLEGKSVPAVWTEGGDKACDEHKPNLEALRDDGYRTEADYQTWERL